MPVNMKDIRSFLDAEEVDYDNAKKLGASALPFLSELAQGADMALASKSIYLASLIKGKASIEILERAAKSDMPILRVTAASGIKNLSETKSGKIFDALIGDSDAGIRKVTLNASAHFTSKKMMTKLSNLAKGDPEPMLRELANKNLAKMEKK